ncbi:hypothetical protein M8C21_025842, partial [Ambrosia artemisiifolia]
VCRLQLNQPAYVRLIEVHFRLKNKQKASLKVVPNLQVVFHALRASESDTVLFKPDEINAIIKQFDAVGTLALRYMVIQGEPGAGIRGKKGAGGICIKKTGQAMVFGIYEEPVAPGQCNMVVERLGDYLVDQGIIRRISHISWLILQVKPEEITGIMNDFNEPGSLAPTGLYLGGTKYMVIQGEPGAVIRGKKGPGGVTIKKTTMSLIIGIYDEPMTPGQCNMIVERLGDYLLEQ